MTFTAERSDRIRARTLISLRKCVVTTEVIDSPEDFAALKPEWDDLYERASNPAVFSTHRWLSVAWRRRVRRPDRAVVIAVREDGELVMGGAFMITKREETPIVRILASGVPQWEDVLWCARDNSLRHAALLLERLQAIKGAHNAFYTTRMPEQSILRQAITAAGLRVRLRKSATLAYLPLSEFTHYADYFSTLTTKLRQDHRRRLRRMQEMDGFSFQIEQGDRRGEALAWLFERKRAWLVERQIRSSAFESGRIDRFIRDYLRGTEGDSWVATLRIKGHIVASSLSLLERDAVNLRVLAHEQAFASYAPGRSLVLMLIEDAVARGVPRFDLGIGDLEWKDRLGARHRELLSERIQL